MMSGHFLCVDFSADFVNQSGKDISEFSAFFLPTVYVTEPPKGAKAGEYVMALQTGIYDGFAHRLANYQYRGIDADGTKEYSDTSCALFGEAEPSVGTTLALKGFNQFKARTTFVLTDVTFADGSTRSFETDWIFDRRTTKDLADLWDSQLSGDS